MVIINSRIQEKLEYIIICIYMEYLVQQRNMSIYNTIMSNEQTTTFI